VAGPLGEHYLSQSLAGGPVQSPCVNAGSSSALAFQLADRTTRVDERADAGVVDLGFHYAVRWPLSDLAELASDVPWTLWDLADFQQCFGGAASGDPEDPCRRFDLSRDGRIRLDDWSIVVRLVSGP